MSFGGALALLPIAIVLFGCSPKTKKYEGTMFIVTKGRQNISLGGSNLFIIKDQDLALHVEDAETWTKQTLPQLAEKALKDQEEQLFTKAAALEQLKITTRLMQKRNALREEYDKKKLALDTETENEIQQLTQNKPETYQGEAVYQYYENQKTLIRLKENYKEESQRLDKKYSKLIGEADAEIKKSDAAQTERIAEAGSASREFGDSSSLAENFNDLFMEYVFSRLPRPFLITRTDSAGRFEFDVPSSERFALAAKETREVITGTETYYWYLHLPDGPTRPGDESIYLDLTNSTSLEGDYPGSVVRLPLDHFEVTE